MSNGSSRSWWSAVLEPDPAMESYRQGLAQRLQREPIKHRLRMGLFQVEALSDRLRWQRRRWGSGKACRDSTVSVDPCLQPPTYRYGNLRGPWIESFFCAWWLRHRKEAKVTYLPLFFDPIYFNSQSQKYSSEAFAFTLRRLERTLAGLDPHRPYFTILGMYDFPIWNWSAFPRNVAVFSAAGWGDLAIPLLSGHRPFHNPPKDLHLSFMGSLSGPSDLNGFRTRMFESLNSIAYFGKGSNWKQIMGRSIFSLCPRGLGRTSLRLVEALSLGSIPVYLWDDREWLPYQDELDWTEFSISLPIDRVHELPAILGSLSADRIAAMQQKIEQLYPRYFTLEATCRWIHARAERLSTLSDVLALTSHREV